ncbi:hypothetical protein SEPCBS57363_005351 [Sporothrix epigloea]|uniref:Uncharacterized protein n=1 Tax=Sporothrix epigloea TaxID=1892477 RepID=A0ABP0DX30_9PEZI
MEVVCLPTYNDYPAHHGRSSRPKHHSKSGPNYDEYDADNRVLYYSRGYDDSKFKAFGRPPENGSQYTEMPSSYDYRHHHPDRSLTERRPYAVSGHTPTLSRGAGSTSAGFYEDPSTSRYAPHGEYRGMGAAGMFGIAAAGAVAGAALTYSVMRSNSQSRSRSSRGYEYDDAEFVPSFQRRSTFPEPLPNYPSSRYDGEGMRGYPPKEVCEIEYIRDFDGRGRFSPSRQKSGGSASDSRTRARSEQAHDRAPLMIAEGSYHSSRNGSSGLPSPARTSSRHGSISKYHAEPTERSDRESYVSGARSHRTARGSGAGGSGLPSIPPNASRSASLRHSGGRPGSYMSARNVPLPPSGAGSSHTRWEEDDRYDDDKRFQYDEWDNDSVAPSDSISCVGSHGPSRRFHR